MLSLYLPIQTNGIEGQSARESANLWFMNHEAQAERQLYAGSEQDTGLDSEREESEQDTGSHSEREESEQDTGSDSKRGESESEHEDSHNSNAGKRRGIEQIRCS